MRGREERVASAFGIPLGPFRLTGRLDQGGMGQVWHAVHAASGLPVAVKLIREDRPELAEPFLEEVRAVARLDHPNIITVLDCGRIDAPTHAASGGKLVLGSPWMAMEYCSGGTLGTSPPRTWDELRVVLADLLSALAYAHARGVLHRDLNPENVLRATAEDARPGRKLTDFGLSTPFSHAEAGVIVGTPAYMAPEQLRAELGGQGPWTDLYQLGCLAWALAAGAPPFGANRPAAVLAIAHLEVEPPAFNPRFRVPSGFEGWLRKLLVKDPQRRIQHAADAAATLEAVEGSGAFSLGVPPTWQSADPPRMPARLVDAGLGVHALRPVPIVGRHLVRDRLWGALREVNVAWAARAVLLHGAAGVGKSRLARWLGERAHELGHAHVLRVEGTDGPLALERLYSRHLGVPLADEADVTLPPASAPGGIAALADHPRIQRARRFVEGVATERPVVLILDDVHRSVEALALVWALCGEDSAAPVLAVLTARSDGLAEAPAEAEALAALAARVELDRVELGPLSSSEEAELMGPGLGLGAPLARRLAGTARGNPGMAVAAVAHLVDRGALRPAPGGFESPPAVPLELSEAQLAPWSDRLARALRRFPLDPAFECLEAAAVLGDPVDEAEWAALCRKRQLRAPPALVEALVRERLAVPVEGPSDAIQWAFAHPMLREALVRRAVAGRRSTVLHADAAALLLARAREGGTPDLARVATHLAGANQAGAALDTWLAAVEHHAAVDDWAGVVGEVAAASAVLAGMASAPDDERRLKVEVWRLRALARGALGAEGADAVLQAARGLEKVVEEARARAWPEVLAQALFARAALADRQGDGAGAATRLAEARAAAWAVGDERLTARADLGLARVAVRRAELGPARTRGEEVLAVASRHDDRRLLGEARVLLADLERRAGQAVRAEALARDALALAGPRSQRPATAAALVVLADLERDRARFDAAIAGYRRALELFEELGDDEVLAVTARLGALLIERGRDDDARQVLGAGVALALCQGIQGPRARLDVLAASVAVRHDEAGAVAALLEAAARLDRWGCVEPDLILALATAERHLREAAGRAGRPPPPACAELTRRVVSWSAANVRAAVG